MKSLSLQIENRSARYALVEHHAARIHQRVIGECQVSELAKLANAATRVILGLNIATLQHHVVEEKFQNVSAEEYHAYYPIKNTHRWQQLSVKKTEVDSVLLTLKQQGMRVHAIDCQILALMRLAKYHGLPMTKQQCWQLIEPHCVILWQSDDFAIKHCAAFYYHKNIEQIKAMIAEHKKQWDIHNEIFLNSSDPKLNPLIGLALWNVI